MKNWSELSSDWCGRSEHYALHASESCKTTGSNFCLISQDNWKRNNSITFVRTDRRGTKNGQEGEETRQNGTKPNGAMLALNSKMKISIQLQAHPFKSNLLNWKLLFNQKELFIIWKKLEKRKNFPFFQRNICNPPFSSQCLLMHSTRGFFSFPVDDRIFFLVFYFLINTPRKPET